MSQTSNDKQKQRRENYRKGLEQIRLNLLAKSRTQKVASLTPEEKEIANAKANNTKPIGWYNPVKV